MRVLRRRLAQAWPLVALLTLTGCGAGLITGIASSSDSNGSPPEVVAPQINLTSDEFPLVPRPGDSRSLIVANALIVGAVEVWIERIDPTTGLPLVGSLQANTTTQQQGSSTVVSFELRTDKILNGLADPSLTDLAGRISVLVEGEPVSNPVPITLVRQPKARLLDSVSLPSFLSPFGQRVAIEVDGLLSTDTTGIEVLVTTRDPNGELGSKVTRLAANVQFGASDGLPTLLATVPGSSFPGQVEIQVLDDIAGQSQPITNAYYRPDVAVALPGQGPTTGGTLLTLIGAALVPYDFSTSPAQLDFSEVTLTFSKGGRVTQLLPGDLRVAESTSDRLVFTMPPSPDGRPGQIDIILETVVDGVAAQVTASQVFLYANPDPFYGPRGAVLDQPPVAAAPIRLDKAPSTEEAPDFAIVTEQGGVGFLQLLLAQQNGMFQPFAAPRQIGNPEVDGERGPRDLLVGDFDGDAIPDLFMVNEGSGNAAVHHLVLGQSRPAPPLGAVWQVPAAQGSDRGHVADFDRDGLPDLLLMPGSNAALGQQPQVLLARPAGASQPGFSEAITVELGNFEFEAFEVADLDGDGNLDIAAVTGRDLILAVAYGVGDGSFSIAVPSAFVVPGYTKSPNSPAVGLHACRDGVRQSLGVVLSGIESVQETSPTLAVLEQVLVGTGPPAVYEFVSPTEDSVFLAPVEPIAVSLAANLDAPEAPADPGPIELVVAIGGEPTIVALGLLQLTEVNGHATFEPLFGAIENGTLGGTEVPVQIRSLTFETAFPATQPSGEAKAVFIVHEVDVDGDRERRLSTRLVTVPQPGQPRLLPPDAGATLSFPVESVVGGNFSPISVGANGSVRDLATATREGPDGRDEVTIVVNDGFGGFPGLGATMTYAGLLPQTMALVPAASGLRDELVLASSDTRLLSWRPEPASTPAGPDAVTAPLRDLIADPVLAQADLSEHSRIRVADVDGDGIQDLVVLMSFDLPQPGADDARLALLRGKGTVAAGEFPFYVPAQLTPVHGNVSDFALGNFVTSGGSSELLEVVVAVPQGTPPAAVDGNHLKFYRYEAGNSPEDARFVFSAVPGGPQSLLAGSEPTLAMATDFDGDGLVDLLVASRGDRSLRLLRNTAAPGLASNDVDVGAFQEALASPKELAAGVPTWMRLSDVNGDGNLDAVVVTEFTNAAGIRRSSVATYLSSGAGEFEDARFASSTRIGTFDAKLCGDVGDWNRDDVPDLFLGWDTLVGPAPPVNLRVLFGGTR